MKHTYIFFFLLIISLVNELIAQNYVPFPTQNARWKMIDASGICDAGNIDYYDYYLIGDTTINNKTYHKIYESMFHIACVMPQTGPNVFYPSHYKGAIREDSQKIYMMTTFDLTEKMLFNFNLQVGDTLTNKGYDIAINPYARVIKTDSVFWANQWRKRYYIFPKFYNINNISVDTFYLTEGVGSSLGSDGFIPRLHNGMDQSTGITCINYNGHTTYLGGTLGLDLFGGEIACTPTTSIPATFSPKTKLKIQPNPLENEGYIIFPDENEVYELAIFDTNGRQILAQKQLQTFFLIEKTTLQSGVYLLYVKDSKGAVATQKLWVR